MININYLTTMNINKHKSNLEDTDFIYCPCGKRNPITAWNCLSCGKPLQSWLNQLYEIITKTNNNG